MPRALRWTYASLYAYESAATSISSSGQGMYSAGWARTVDTLRRPRSVTPLQAYTVEEVAEILHIGRDKVYGWHR